jgi:hypothetical protein
MSDKIPILRYSNGLRIIATLDRLKTLGIYISSKFGHVTINNVYNWDIHEAPAQRHLLPDIAAKIIAKLVPKTDKQKRVSSPQTEPQQRSTINTIPQAKQARTDG